MSNSTDLLEEATQTTFMRDYTTVILEFLDLFAPRVAS